MLRIKENETSTLTSNRHVPLKEVQINSKLHSFAADVTLTQVFQNDETVPIEAVYCFPVEENAAIYKFMAKIDDEREIIAELKEKKAAQQEYSGALAQGHGAYLLEQDENSNDIFIVSVGALKPGSKCNITISYVSELDLLHSTKQPIIRFTIPTTIAPRYSSSDKGISSPGGTQTQYVQSVPYTLDFVCHIEKYDQHISGISSSSHPIKIDMSNEEFFLVTFSQQNNSLDRDILIDVALSDIRKNTIAAMDRGAVMVSFIPNELDYQQSSKNEFFFVIDCSGSMDGEDKIGLARKAMLLFLKSLPVDCSFNIIRFGSTHSALFTDQATRKYDQNSMNLAENMIKNMGADLGGTELLEPFKWFKNNKPSEGYIRQIFLLTDGEISNVNEVTELCRSMAQYTRIFSFGLGDSPSRALVKGLARATNGCFAFIPPQTNVDIYVAEQLERALQPNITDLNVNWNTSQTILHKVPDHATAVFVGDRLLFYALLDDTVAFDHTINVEICVGTEQKPIGTANIDRVPSIAASKSITHLAVKALLRQLSDASLTENKESIIALSTKYGILCPYTAFIGIERRLDANNKDNANMELREVPIMINKITTDAFHLSSCMSSTRNSINSTYYLMQSNMNQVLARNERLDDLEALFNRSELLCMQQSMFSTHRSIRRNLPSSIRATVGSMVGSLSSLFAGKSVSSSASDNNAVPRVPSYSVSSEQSKNNESHESNIPASMYIWPTDEQKLIDRFIELQRFDGLWILSENDVQQLTGKTMMEYTSSVIKNIDKEHQSSVIGTAIVLIVLDTRCTSKRTLWQALSNKANNRLKELFGGEESKLEQFMKDMRNQLK